ncbi:MAG: phosphoglycerate dehydrogenase [Clostridia bacterium]|nr:phosphoglycerate dehydrogenase [Clostridia bacterium]
MTEILKLNSIASVVKENLPEDRYTISENAAAPAGILVRSADMLSYDFPASVLAVARAGAGVNNIPVDVCAEKGIVVFNTPGANANAVKELVLGAMIAASRNVCAAAEWAKTLKGNGDAVAKMAEKGKGQFVGPEVAGKTLGVIGLGAIGGLVANAAYSLGMNVIGYDPFVSVDAAWRLSRHVQKADNLDEIFAQSDIISLHVPQIDATKGMINVDSIAKMKDGVIILNFARGGLVKEGDVIAACESGKIYKYATDFASDALIGVKNTLILPHLGASTPESEDNCAVMASRELRDYLEDGNIVNSVNYPAASLARSGSARLTVLHKNTSNMVGAITAVIAGAGENISGMINASKGDYAYTIIDVDHVIPSDTVQTIENLANVIRVRVL